MDNRNLPWGVELPSRHGWPVTLQAGAVVLRPLRRADEERWFAVRRADWKWLEPWEATRPPRSREQVGSFARMVATNRRRGRCGTALPWAIGWDDGWPDHPLRNRAAAPLVGQVTVSGITLGSAMSCSMGYWVASSHAGRGIAPTAVALACDYVFQVMCLHRVEICIRPENAKSLRVVEKLGMAEEGLRPSYLHIDGQWRDHRVFRLLEQDRPDGVLRTYLRDHVLPGSGLDEG